MGLILLQQWNSQLKLGTCRLGSNSMIIYTWCFICSRWSYCYFSRILYNIAKLTILLITKQYKRICKPQFNKEYKYSSLKQSSTKTQKNPSHDHLILFGLARERKELLEPVKKKAGIQSWIAVPQSRQLVIWFTGSRGNIK